MHFLSIFSLILLSGCYTTPTVPPENDVAKNEPTAVIIQKEENLKERDPLLKGAKLGENVIVSGNETYDTPIS